MMTTYEEHNLNPDIAEFKVEMFNLCTGIANVANEIGRAEPAWGTDVTNDVNQKLNKAVSNVARLPDELAGGIIQIAGAHVHTIGRLMQDSFTTPATIAPLARSAVEYSALLMFLNRPEAPEVRTVRAARALRAGMNRDKVHKQAILDDLYSNLNKVVQSYTRKHVIPELSHDELSYSQMIEKTSGELVGSDFYSQLCSYTHHNTWKAFHQFFVADKNPTSLELDSLYFAYKTSLSLAGAAFTLLPYRDNCQTGKFKAMLNDQTSRMLLLGEKIDLYLSTHANA